MSKLIGTGIAALASVILVALAVQAEFAGIEANEQTYPLYFGAALIAAAVVGIIRDRGNRPTIEG